MIMRFTSVTPCGCSTLCSILISTSYELVKVMYQKACDVLMVCLPRQALIYTKHFESR